MEKTIKLTNPTGLHARPAGIFVKHASQFKSEVEISFKEKTINAKSIMGVMSLGLGNGDEFVIRTTGDDESEAMDALVKLIESGFGE